MDDPRERWVRTFVGGVLLLAAAVLLWRVREVIVIVLLAVVCAYVLRPLVEAICGTWLRLRQRPLGLSRSAATGVVFFLVVLVVWAIGILSAPSLGRQVDELQARWPRLRDRLVGVYSDGERYYRERLPPSLRPAVDSWTESAGKLVTAAASKGLGVTVQSVGLIIELFLVPILAFYFLADGPGIRQQALFFVPRRYLARTEQTLERADDMFQRYIKGQVILCLIAFAVVTLGLWAIGVDFYLLLGLIAGLTRAVPIIGPIVGAIPILIVVLLTKSFAISLWVLVLFSVMHLLESKFVMPAVLGQQLDLHPVLIIVALLIGAQMGGLLGVFLAAPVLAVVKVLIAQRRDGSPVRSGEKARGS